MGGKCFQTTSMVASISMALLLNGCAATGGLKSVTSEQATQPPITAPSKDSTLHRSTPAIRVSRYVSAYAQVKPSQMNLLDQVIVMRFPHTIHTIGEAIAYLLQFSGYRLVDCSTRPIAMREILVRALPEPLRQLNNVTLSQALLSLVGSDFQLLYDPVHRLISFDLKPQAKLIFNTHYPLRTNHVH